MIFLDGPASVKSLDLRRHPLFLRAVIDADGTVDALDQLDDTPKASEAIFVYRREGAIMRYHLLCTPRRLSGWHQTADYRLYGEQPSDEILRDTIKWREWAAAQRAAAWKPKRQEAAP